MPPRRFSVESQTYCFLLKMGRSLIYHEQMNVEAVKAQMLEDIESLEGECKRLLELIPRYRSDLARE